MVVELPSTPFEGKTTYDEAAIQHPLPYLYNIHFFGFTIMKEFSQEIGNIAIQKKQKYYTQVS